MKKKIDKHLKYAIILGIILLIIIPLNIIDSVNKDNYRVSLENQNNELLNKNVSLQNQLDSIKHIPITHDTIYKFKIKYKVKKDTIYKKEYLPEPIINEYITRIDTLYITRNNFINLAGMRKYDSLAVYPIINEKTSNDWLDKLLIILGTALGTYITTEATK
jgi:hypothetical protein